MYTENSIMRFGKYRYFRLADVPAEYLRHVYRSKSLPDASLFTYIETHREKLGLEKEVKVEKRRMVCDKVAYPTEQWARQSMDLLNRHPRGAKKSRRRCYYCEKCGLWHLTSMSLEVWQAEPSKRRMHHSAPVGKR